MTNEEIVASIQQGDNVEKNMYTLYVNNIVLINKVCRMFEQYAEKEDLLQTAFLALYDAVKGYDLQKGYKFMTYATQVIKQELVRYVDECCQVVRIPEHRQAQIIKYKRFCNDYEICNGCKPTDEELCRYLFTNTRELKLIRKYAQPPQSLDAEIYNGHETYTLADIIQDDTDIAEEVCDEIFDKQLWEIIKETLPEDHATVLKSRYINNMTYEQTSKVLNLPPQKCRQLEHEGIRKLSFGKARAKLQRELSYEVDSRIYKNGLCGFREHFSSQVERLALRTLELKEEFIRANKERY